MNRNNDVDYFKRLIEEDNEMFGGMISLRGKRGQKTRAEAEAKKASADAAKKASADAAKKAEDEAKAAKKAEDEAKAAKPNAWDQPIIETDQNPILSIDLTPLKKKIEFFFENLNQKLSLNCSTYDVCDAIYILHNELKYLIETNRDDLIETDYYECYQQRMDNFHQKILEKHIYFQEKNSPNTYIEKKKYNRQESLPIKNRIFKFDDEITNLIENYIQVKDPIKVNENCKKIVKSRIIDIFNDEKASNENVEKKDNFVEERRWYKKKLNITELGFMNEKINLDQATIKSTEFVQAYITLYPAIKYNVQIRTKLTVTDKTKILEIIQDDFYDNIVVAGNEYGITKYMYLLLPFLGEDMISVLKLCESQNIIISTFKDKDKEFISPYLLGLSSNLGYHKDEDKNVPITVSKIFEKNKKIDFNKDEWNKLNKWKTKNGDNKRVNMILDWYKWSYILSVYTYIQNLGKSNNKYEYEFILNGNNFSSQDNLNDLTGRLNDLTGRLNDLTGRLNDFEKINPNTEDIYEKKKQYFKVFFDIIDKNKIHAVRNNVYFLPKFRLGLDLDSIKLFDNNFSHDKLKTWSQSLCSEQRSKIYSNLPIHDNLSDYEIYAKNSTLFELEAVLAINRFWSFIQSHFNQNVVTNTTFDQIESIKEAFLTGMTPKIFNLRPGAGKSFISVFIALYNGFVLKKWGDTNILPIRIFGTEECSEKIEDTMKVMIHHFNETFNNLNIKMKFHGNGDKELDQYDVFAIKPSIHQQDSRSNKEVHVYIASLDSVGDIMKYNYNSTFAFNFHYFPDNSIVADHAERLKTFLSTQCYITIIDDGINSKVNELLLKYMDIIHRINEKYYNIPNFQKRLCLWNSADYKGYSLYRSDVRIIRPVQKSFNGLTIVTSKIDHYYYDMFKFYKKIVEMNVTNKNILVPLDMNDRDIVKNFIRMGALNKNPIPYVFDKEIQRNSYLRDMLKEDSIKKVSQIPDQPNESIMILVNKQTTKGYGDGKIKILEDTDTKTLLELKTFAIHSDELDVKIALNEIGRLHKLRGEKIGPEQYKEKAYVFLISSIADIIKEDAPNNEVITINDFIKLHNIETKSELQPFDDNHKFITKVNRSNSNEINFINYFPTISFNQFFDYFYTKMAWCEEHLSKKEDEPWYVFYNKVFIPVLNSKNLVGKKIKYMKNQYLADCDFRKNYRVGTIKEISKGKYPHIIVKEYKEVLKPMTYNILMVKKDERSSDRDNGNKYEENRRVVLQNKKDRKKSLMIKLKANGKIDYETYRSDDKLKQGDDIVKFEDNLSDFYYDDVKLQFPKPSGLEDYNEYIKTSGLFQFNFNTFKLFVSDPDLSDNQLVKSFIEYYEEQNKKTDFRYNICNFCGKLGHIYKSCPYKDKEYRYALNILNDGHFRCWLDYQKKKKKIQYYPKLIFDRKQRSSPLSPSQTIVKTTRRSIIEYIKKDMKCTNLNKDQDIDTNQFTYILYTFDENNSSPTRLDNPSDLSSYDHIFKCNK